MIGLSLFFAIASVLFAFPAAKGNPLAIIGCLWAAFLAVIAAYQG